MNKNFAIIGCAGFVAPKHLEAIKTTENKVIAALDPNDSVGILDKFYDNVDFFTEFERFDRHLEKLKRESPERKVDFISICSPNYLHDSHCRFALRIGANAICEKPLVLNPWNLTRLIELERETGKRIFPILQLRLHPKIQALKQSVESSQKQEKYIIDLNYIAPRGNWYLFSWKGHTGKSGGLASNLGVHFFDMLIWIFGKVIKSEIHLSEDKKTSGFLELEKAKVSWNLSIDKNNLPEKALYNNKNSYKSLKIDGKEIEFSENFENLHIESYKKILSGEGFSLQDTLPAIELISQIRKSETLVQIPAPIQNHIQNNEKNPVLTIIDSAAPNFFVHTSSIIDENVSIGKGTKIWHFSHILPNTKIGSDCSFGMNSCIGPNVQMGDNCKVQNRVTICDGVSIESDVFIGPGVIFLNVLNPRSFINRTSEFAKTLVKKGTTIGGNATIIPGNELGEYSFIGAHALITKPVKPYALMLGSPAKLSGWVCKCGEILTHSVNIESEKIVQCLKCESQYLQRQDSLMPINEK